MQQYIKSLVMNANHGSRKMRRLISLKWTFFFILFTCLIFPVFSANSGRIVIDSIYSPSLAGNVTGESPTRELSIYLPPDYDTRSNNRYPVIYLLHGIGDTNKNWTNGKQPLTSIQSLIALGSIFFHLLYCNSRRSMVIYRHMKKALVN